MIGSLALWLATAVLLALAALVVWRRWIQPWRELEDLVSAVVQSEKPRKLLMTANPRANVLGLALGKLAERQQELQRSTTEGLRSVEAILGALPDGLAVVDDQRRLQLMNAEFQRLFTTGTGAGVSMLEATRDAAVDLAITRSLTSGEVQRDVIKVTRGTDSPSHVEVSAVPFRSEEGKTGAVVLFRDISQMQQVEAMRRDFVANVSHELRTPLSIFRGYLETLLDDPRQPPGELIRILEVMDRHAERLTLLVEDILSLAQLESPGARLEFTGIYLPDFLGGILRDWEKRFGAKLLEASLDAPADLPIISADENRLQEVVYNLLDNAVKYSQPEGKIWLKAERRGDQVRIAVADEGIGIPTRDLPRVFERFYRADKARSRQLGGTGLGLSIVKHIAQLHGGSVQAESEIGHGATISVLLPIVPASRRLPDEVGVTES
ncbi:MAG: PAS domain-containing protein [Chthoniobacterales bacterium]|nr:PAS domain-containing protein [Chthoniobacterales bacterium]